MKIKNILIIISLAIAFGGVVWIFIRGGFFGVCGSADTGFVQDVSYCDVSCNTENDCKHTCDCGVINKNESCRNDSLKCKASSSFTVKCIDNKCAFKEKTVKTETDNWNNYKNDDYGFEVKYPENYILEKKIYSKSWDEKTYWRIFTPEEWKDRNLHNPFVGVLAIETNLSPAEWLDEKGTTISMLDDTSNLTEEEKEESANALFHNVSGREEAKIGNYNFLKFLSSRISGQDEHFLAQGDGFLVEIHRHSSGLGEIPAETFERMIYSFEFVKKNSSARNCPDETTIDCMPAVGSSPSGGEYCEAGYRAWIETNCPETSFTD